MISLPWLEIIITGLLAVNAKFIWSLLVSIKNIEVSITKYIANYESIERRVEEIEESRKTDKARAFPAIEGLDKRLALVEAELEEIDNLRKSRHELGNFVQKLEGRVAILEMKAGA